jgi:hypothetical protein
VSRGPFQPGPQLRAVPVLPCQQAQKHGISWTSYDDRQAAAELCKTCSSSSSCLLEALRLDAAARRGDDLWGVAGVWGGCWFGHGAMPRRVLRQVQR